MDMITLSILGTAKWWESLIDSAVVMHRVKFIRKLK